jgi:hypothetical protein
LFVLRKASENRFVLRRASENRFTIQSALLLEGGWETGRAYLPGDMIKKLQPINNGSK